MTDKSVPSILEHFKFKPPKPYTNSKASPQNAPDPSLLYGVELEIEHCQEDMCVVGMNQTEDGSLRNGGLEFITLPMSYSNLVYVLERFFRQNSFLNASNYSERCSVHVHTNVSDMTVEQLASLTMLYQVFEGVLFNYVGDDRRRNIFCVPWAETQLSHRSVQKMLSKDDMVFHDWQKYTALNLLPVPAQGSIEWRHLGGTHNLPRILEWCRLIGHMYALAKDKTFNEIKGMIINLNSTSEYTNLIEAVFKEDAHALSSPVAEQLMENGVLAMKYSIMQPKRATYARPRADVDNTIQELRQILRRGNPPMIFDDLENIEEARQEAPVFFGDRVVI